VLYNAQLHGPEGGVTKVLFEYFCGRHTTQDYNRAKAMVQKSYSKLRPTIPRFTATLRTFKKHVLHSAIIFFS
jgi:hypothetical protein